MAIRPLKFDLAKVLKETFDRDQRIALSPVIRNGSVKRQFGRECVEEILKRTNSGRDKNNQSFASYSKSYKDSKTFSLYGKSSRVNLKLTGQMQAAMNVIETGPTSVSIGFPSPEQAKKAGWHVNGSGSLPVRDFWGLSLEDQGKILKGILRRQNAEEDFTFLEQFSDAVAAAVTFSSTTQEQQRENRQVLSGSLLATLGRVINGQDD